MKYYLSLVEQFKRLLCYGFGIGVLWMCTFNTSYNNLLITFKAHSYDLNVKDKVLILVVLDKYIGVSMYVGW